MKSFVLTRKRRLILSACCMLGLLAGGMALSGPSWQTGPVAVRGSDFELSVGAVRLPLSSLVPSFVAPAFGQTGSLSADDLTLSTADAVYTIKHIDMANTALSRADLVAMFDGAGKTPYSTRLAKLTAASATIPELVIDYKNGRPTRIVYQNVKLTGLDKGIVASATADGATVTTTNPASGEVKGTYGAIEIKAIDLPAALRVFAESQPVGTDAGKVLYDALSVKNIRIMAAKPGLEATIASVTSGTTRLRAGGASNPANNVGTGAAASAVADATRAVTNAVANKGKSSAQPPLADKDSAALRRLSDVLAQLDVGPVEMKDLKGTAQSDGKTTAFGATRAFMTGVGSGKIGNSGIESIHVDADDGHVKIASVSAGGMDLTASLDSLVRPSDDVMQRMKAGQLTLSTIDVDLPADKAGAAGLAGRTTFQIEKIGFVGSDDGKDKRSLRFAAAMDHLTTALNLSPDSDFKELAEMGYSKLDLSSSLGFAWNAASKELTIDDISLNGVDMGKAKILASLSNVDGDLFSGDVTRSQAAALVMIAKKLEVRLENAGLFEKEIAVQAKRENKTPDEVRQQFVQMAAFGIPAFLGSDEGAKSIAAAIAKFIANPKTLRVTAVAPSGFGASDLPLIHEPADVLRKLEITAVANE